MTPTFSTCFNEVADMVHPIEPRDDGALVVEYARTNDREALEQLLRRRWAEAYRLALRALGDPAAAEDAAQDAFISLVRGAARFEPTRDFGSWFRTLVMNAVRMSARSRGRRSRHEARTAAARPAFAAGVPEGERRLEASEIEEHVRKLPLDLRFAVLLHFYEGRAHDEVAEVIGCPKGTASSRIRRGLEKLRESLAGAGYAATLEGLEASLGAAAKIPVATPATPSVAALQSAAASLVATAFVVKVATAALAVVLAGAGVFVALRPAPGIGSRAQVAPPAMPLPPGEAGARSAPGEGARDGASLLRNAGSRDSPPRQDGSAPGVPPLPRGEAGARSAPGEGARDGVQRDPRTHSPASGEKDARGFLVTVRDRSGATVPGALVRVRSLENDASVDLDMDLGFMPLAQLCVGEARTDAGGCATVTVGAIEATDRFACVYARHGLDAGVSRTVPLPLTGVDTLDVTVSAPDHFVRENRGAIIAEVVANGAPCRARNLHLSVSFRHDRGEGYTRRTIETDDGGILVARSCEPGDYEIELRDDALGNAHATCKVKASEVTKVRLAFEAGATISGRVDLGGAHASNVVVRLRQPGHHEQDQRAALAPNGSYSFRGVGTGAFEIEAYAPGFGRVSTEVTVDRAAVFTAPELALGRGASVKGRIVAKDRRPLAGALVVLGAPDKRVFGAPLSTVFGAVASCDDGTFSIAGLPAGTGTLRVTNGSVPGSLPGVLATLMYDAPFESENQVHVERTVEIPRDGTLAIGDVVLDVSDAKPARLTGHLRGPDGKPVAGAEVVVCPESARLACRVTTDGSGAYVTDEIEPGRYSLFARGGDLVTPDLVAVEVREGDPATADLTLAKGGALSGTVHGTAERLAKLEVAAFPDATGDSAITARPLPAWSQGLTTRIAPDGRYRLAGLPPGRYIVSVPECLRNAELVLALGHEETVDFTLSTRAGGKVTVKLANAPADSPLLGTAYRGSMRTGNVDEDVAQGQLADGQAVLDGIPDGAFGVMVIVVSRVGGVYGVFRDGLSLGTDGTAEVVLTAPDLAQAGKITGRIEGAANPSQLEAIAVGDGVIVVSHPGADGTFTIGVPPGDYRVAAVSSIERHGDFVGVPLVTVGANGTAGPITLKAPAK